MRHGAQAWAAPAWQQRAGPATAKGETRRAPGTLSCYGSNAMPVCWTMLCAAQPPALWRAVKAAPGRPDPQQHPHSLLHTRARNRPAACISSGSTLPRLQSHSRSTLGLSQHPLTAPPPPLSAGPPWPPHSAAGRLSHACDHTTRPGERVLRNRTSGCSASQSVLRPCDCSALGGGCTSARFCVIGLAWHVQHACMHACMHAGITTSDAVSHGTRGSSTVLMSCSWLPPPGANTQCGLATDPQPAWCAPHC
jgi:hypothetical protein